MKKKHSYSLEGARGSKAEQIVLLEARTKKKPQLCDAYLAIEEEEEKGD